MTQFRHFFSNSFNLIFSLYIPIYAQSIHLNQPKTLGLEKGCSKDMLTEARSAGCSPAISRKTRGETFFRFNIYTYI